MKNIPVPVDSQSIGIKDLLFKLLNDHESAVVIGVRGTGKDILYKAFLDDTQHNSCRPIVSKLLTDEEELHELQEELDQASFPLTLVISLSIHTDVSWVIKKLDALRTKQGTDFVAIIFSNLLDVYDAYSQNIKLVRKHLHILKPLSKEDTAQQIKEYGRRYAFQPSEKQIHLLTELSGGHIGLIKSLYMLIKNDNSYVLNIENLLNEASIQYRLEATCSDIPQELFMSLVKNTLNPEQRTVLKTFGIYDENDNYFSPLFKEYLHSRNPTQDETLYFFTSSELALFEYLRKNSNTIIDREAIAEVLWQEEWEEKYSDWAIDQIMYRIRKKINKAKLPYNIQTKKGVGFIFNAA